MSKTPVVENRTTDLVRGNVTFAVTDPTAFKCLKVDRIGDNTLKVLRHNYEGNAWEEVYSEERQVILHRRNPTCKLTDVGTYTVEGAISGDITIWTEEV